MTRILIIDDHPLVLKAIERHVSRTGAEVVAKIEPVSPEGFDGAILDWHPHGADMVGLCGQHGVPFVVYTASPQDVPEGLPVVEKPAPVEKVLVALFMDTRGRGA